MLGIPIGDMENLRVIADDFTIANASKPTVWLHRDFRLNRSTHFEATGRDFPS
jgi:hypothetical protein